MVVECNNDKGSEKNDGDVDEEGGGGVRYDGHVVQNATSSQVCLHTLCEGTMHVHVRGHSLFACGQ